MSNNNNNNNNNHNHQSAGKSHNGRNVVARLVFVTLLCTAMLTSATFAHAEQEKTVQWNESWSRVRVIEMLNIIALTIGSILIHESPVSDHAKWNSPILFDRSARRLFKLDSARGKEAAANVSDYIYKGAVLAPYIIDNYFVTLGVHQNADVALQMTLIDMQSLGISGVLTLAAEHVSGRARPYISDCPPGGKGLTTTGFNECGNSDDFQSFYSGHAAAAFTMAGLTCAHHQHLPLYGGGLPDVAPCAVMIALGLMSGMTRMMSDRHWASDVLAGAGVGVLSGYVLPLWMHYGFGSKAPLPTTIQTSAGTLAPFPQIFDGGAGIGLALF